MKIENDPWHDSHAPAYFHRTDPTGRYSPLYREPETDWVAIGICLVSIGVSVTIFLDWWYNN